MDFKLFLREIFLLFAGLFVCSCNNTTATSNSNVSNDENMGLSLSPVRSDIFKQGDSIAVNFIFNGEVEPDSVVLWVDRTYIGKIDNGYLYTVSHSHRVGYIPYKVEVYADTLKTTSVSEFFIKPSMAPVNYTYRVKNTFPHDGHAYTQGLFWDDGYLYEGTGLEGQSTLRKVSLFDGNVIKYIELSPEYFGEGITMIGNKIYQLTWRHGKGFVYNMDTFEKIHEFGYSGQGWGLAADGELLYMSNGSNRINIIDPETFRILRYIDVFTDKEPVVMLNELEWINGEIWANVYQTDNIVRIDPATGVVTGIIDMSKLLPISDRTTDTDVLNGIAYDEDGERIFVTGKNWKKLFEIEVLEK
ncbi:MAG: glutaminyl-peptide cyclotransferase [Rikenellaceae bacterium]|nr:glutaminyl-peptide cyclotransferase [Rikenellaceae bacterium]